MIRHSSSLILRYRMVPALLLLIAAVSAIGSLHVVHAAAQDDGLVVSQATFVDGEGGEHGGGTAVITQDEDGSLTLRLEDFSVSEGPELVVILSPDASPTRASATSIAALQVGQLKSRFGSQSYSLPIGTDASDYRSVFIFCKEYNVVMTLATF